jgi:hypothetical protein
MEKAPRERGFLLPVDDYRPPGAGVSVEPLGEGLISVLPEGFRALLAPAAALPAALDMPVPAAVPVALPVVVPVAGEPIVPLAAAPPVVDPPAEPVPDCASAKVPVNASAVARPNVVASFMIAPCCCCITANGVRQHCVPAERSQFVAVPPKSSAANKRRQPTPSVSKQLKIVRLNLVSYQRH